MVSYFVELCNKSFFRHFLLFKICNVTIKLNVNPQAQQL